MVCVAGPGGVDPASWRALGSFGRNVVRPSSRVFVLDERIDPAVLNSIRPLARPCRAGWVLSGTGPGGVQALRRTCS